MQKTILSTADVARLFDVTETTVKRWADEGTLKCQRTPGGHRKFEIRNVVEFAEKNQFDPVGALALADEDRFPSDIQAAVLRRDFPVLVRGFLERGLANKDADLFGFLSYLYEHRIELWEIVDNVIRPALADVGERWAKGEAGITEEHRISQRTIDALARMQSQILTKPRVERSALLACLGEELHEIGLRCMASLFLEEGWSVAYLGARTPGEAVITAIGDTRPSVVCLSVTQPAVVPMIHRSLGEIVVAAHGSGSPVWVGGNGVSPGMGGEHTADALLSSGQDLIEAIGLLERGQKTRRKNGSAKT